jgi:hypothetical protein
MHVGNPVAALDVTRSKNKITMVLRRNTLNTPSIFAPTGALPANLIAENNILHAARAPPMQRYPPLKNKTAKKSNNFYFQKIAFYFQRFSSENRKLNRGSALKIEKSIFRGALKIENLFFRAEPRCK